MAKIAYDSNTNQILVATDQNPVPPEYNDAVRDATQRGIVVTQTAPIGGLPDNCVAGYILSADGTECFSPTDAHTHHTADTRLATVVKWVHENFQSPKFQAYEFHEMTEMAGEPPRVQVGRACVGFRALTYSTVYAAVSYSSNRTNNAKWKHIENNLVPWWQFVTNVTTTGRSRNAWVGDASRYITGARFRTLSATTPYTSVEPPVAERPRLLTSSEVTNEVNEILYG